MTREQEKKLSDLESNILALQTIARQMAAGLADLRKELGSSRPLSKKKTDQAYFDAVVLQAALTKNYRGGNSKPKMDESDKT